MSQNLTTWQELLLALLEGSLTIEQFTTRRYRARKANKRTLCLAMAKAYELYTLEQLHNKDQ